MLGDQAARLKMQDLKQGEGIIDMINTYLQILLDNGFLGLSLFLIFIVIPTLRTLAVSRQLAGSDPRSSQLGASLVACTVGTLIMIESGGCDRAMVSVLVGLMAAYVCMDAPRTASAATRARAPRPRSKSASPARPTDALSRELGSIGEPEP